MTSDKQPPTLVGNPSSDTRRVTSSSTFRNRVVNPLRARRAEGSHKRRKDCSVLDPSMEMHHPVLESSVRPQTTTRSTDRVRAAAVGAGQRLAHDMNAPASGAESDSICGSPRPGPSHRIVGRRTCLGLYWQLLDSDRVLLFRWMLPCCCLLVLGALSQLECESGDTMDRLLDWLKVFASWAGIYSPISRSSWRGRQSLHCYAPTPKTRTIPACSTRRRSGVRTTTASYRVRKSSQVEKEDDRALRRMGWWVCMGRT